MLKADTSVIYIDEKGCILSTNQAFQNMVQYSFKELQQLNLSKIEHPDDTEEEKNWKREIRKSQKGEFHTDKRFLRKDGIIIWTSINVSLFGENIWQYIIIPK